MASFNEILAGIEHGAAAVYHQALAIEPDVSRWVTDHPEIEALVDQGLRFSIDFMARTAGIPPGTVTLLTDDILAGIKLLAARDHTVQSGALALFPLPLQQKVATA